MEDESQEATDPSSEMDMVPVFEADGTTAEMEAMGIQAILESNGIPAMTVGTSCIPSLPFEVRVPKEDLDRALSAIADAQAAGPAAAEEAERAGEQQG
jgi:hypothetical protein